MGEQRPVLDPGEAGGGGDDDGALGEPLGPGHQGDRRGGGVRDGRAEPFGTRDRASGFPLDRAGQRDGDVALCPHAELVVPVHAAPHVQLAEDVARVGYEVLVEDGLLAAGNRCAHGPLEGLAARLLAGAPPAEHHKVGDGVRAGSAPVRPLGQAQGEHQVPELGQFAPGSRVLRVERVPGREQGDHPSRPDEVQALEQEMVVDRVAARVVDRVAEGEPAEGDVAHRRVEISLGDPGVREALGQDGGTGVQRPADARRGRVQLHPGHLRPCRGAADERPRAASRLQYPPALEAELFKARPDRFHVGPVGVVRVQRVPGGCPVLVLAQERVQSRPGLGETLVTLVEDPRDGAPAGPTG